LAWQSRAKAGACAYVVNEVVEFFAREVEGDAFGRFSASDLLHDVKHSESVFRKSAAAAALASRYGIRGAAI
jgi:hypothetical protein